MVADLMPVADLKTLSIEPAEVYPAATDHIPEMIALIERLFEKNLAYQSADGCVYFSLDRFPGYGKLAHIDRENQISGVRIRNDEYDKDAVADFALWKAWDEADGDVWWDSPWGPGRPGWHIDPWVSFPGKPWKEQQAECQPATS